MPNQAAVLQAFSGALYAAGIQPPPHVIADGEIHRCDTQQKNGKNDAAYKLYLDDHPAGGYQNHQSGEGWVNWTYRADVPPPVAAPLIQLATPSKVPPREATPPPVALSACKPCAEHPYLTAKQLRTPAGSLADKYGRLALPIYGEDGLQSVQYIANDGTKRYLWGANKDGGYNLITPATKDNNTAIITSGYATALAVATIASKTHPDAAVYCAFDDANMVSVATVLRNSGKHQTLIIASDNDSGKKDDSAARYNAKITQQGLASAIIQPPTGGGCDWDDYLREHGIEAAVEAFAPQPDYFFRDVADLILGARAPQWIVKHYLEANSLAVIYGAPATGKSFVAIDIACHIATGKPWLEHGLIKQSGAVYYIAGEGHNGLARRFAAWQLHNELQIPRDKLYISHTAIQAVDEASAKAASNEIDNRIAGGAPKPLLVVIDTLARNFGGNENDAKDMASFINHLDKYLRIKYGCCVLIIHHSGHQSDRARGSTALKGAVDIEYGLKLDEKTKQISLQNHKMKEGELRKEQSLMLKQVPLGMVDDDQQMITSAVITLYKLGDVKAALAEDSNGQPVELERALLAIHDSKTQWLNIAQLSATLDINKHQATEITNRLAAAGYIIKPAKGERKGRLTSEAIDFLSFRGALLK